MEVMLDNLREAENIQRLPPYYHTSLRLPEEDYKALEVCVVTVNRVQSNGVTVKTEDSIAV